MWAMTSGLTSLLLLSFMNNLVADYIHSELLFHPQVH